MSQGSQPGFKELSSPWAPRVGEGLATVLSTFIFSSPAPKLICESTHLS